MALNFHYWNSYVIFALVMIHMCGCSSAGPTGGASIRAVSCCGGGAQALCRQNLDTAHREGALSEQRTELKQLRNAAARIGSDIASLESQLNVQDARISRCQQLIAEWPGHAQPEAATVLDEIGAAGEGDPAAPKRTIR